MFEAFQQWIDSTKNSSLMENMTNEMMIAHLTSPIGLGIAAVLVVFFVIMKWRLSAVIVTAIIAGIYIVRYTISDTDGPNSSIFLFIGGAALLGGFVIYFTLMQEE